MGHPTKGTRKIHVKGRDYRWCLSRNAGTVYVWSQGGGRCKMAMKMPWLGLSKAFDKKERSYVAVTPKDVRHAILHALNCGWSPENQEPWFDVPPIQPKYEDIISFVKKKYYQEVLDEGFRTTPE